MVELIAAADTAAFDRRVGRGEGLVLVTVVREGRGVVGSVATAEAAAFDLLDFR